MNDRAAEFFEWNGVIGGLDECCFGSVVIGCMAGKKDTVAPYTVAD
jgi:hypothetical protein